MESTYKLVDFIIGVKFGDLGKDVVESVKKQTLDIFATALGGGTREGIRELYEVVKDWGGKEESSVINFGGKFPAPNAAMVNAAMAHALDFDDTHDKAVIHCAVAAVPPAFAISQSIGGVSGKEFIAAVAAGVDVHCRFGLATKKAKTHFPEGGWHWTTLFGYISSAGVTGKLMCLDREKLINALGIAYHQAAGNLLCALEGSQMKRIGPGMAVRGGMMAAQMAGKGITGAKDIIDSPIGIFQMYHAGYDEAAMFGSLGKTFASVETSYKPYPCCRGNHPFIDGTLKVFKDNKVKPDEVIEIIPIVSPIANQLCEPYDVKSQPRNVVDSQFSIPWALACAAVRGKAGLDEFTVEAIKQPDLLAMALKVKPELDNSSTDDLIGESVTVKLKTKRGEFQVKTGPILGSPTNTLTFDMLEEKFMDCAAHAPKKFREKDLKKVVELVKGLEDVKDVGKIIEILA